MSWPDRVLKWLEPEDNPRNTIYGTIAVGLVIAAEEPADETYARLVIAAAAAVVTYWLAHGYAHWVDQRLRRGAAETGSRGHFGVSLAHEWPLTEGAAAPLAALLVAWAIGAPLTTGVMAALGTAAATLVVFEVAGGLRRRSKPLQLLANAAVGLMLGAGLIGVKLVLH